MNTFSSDLSNILSVREKERATVGVTVDVPVIKADTIKKENTDSEKKNAEPEKKNAEPEVKQEEREE